MKIKIIEEYQNKKYTGNNRCVPCTILNIGIAVISTIAILRKSRVAGISSLIGFLGIIYIRGYLIPGTPTLTKRYLPVSVLRWFGKAPKTVATEDGLKTSGQRAASMEQEKQVMESQDPIMNPNNKRDTDSESLSGHNPEKYFLQLEILEPCENNNDLCLTTTFEDNWSDVINSKYNKKTFS